MFDDLTAATLNEMIPGKKTVTLTSVSSATGPDTERTFRVFNARKMALTLEQQVMLGADVSTRYCWWWLWKRDLAFAAAPDPVRGYSITDPDGVVWEVQRVLTDPTGVQFQCYCQKDR